MSHIALALRCLETLNVHTNPEDAANALATLIEDAVAGAYGERDECISLIARLALDCGREVGIETHDGRPLVVVDLPVGQLSWFVRSLAPFAWLKPFPSNWDGGSPADTSARIVEAVAKGMWSCPTLPPPPPTTTIRPPRRYPVTMGSIGTRGKAKTSK
jgi:hypothetical protein